MEFPLIPNGNFYFFLQISGTSQEISANTQRIAELGENTNRKAKATRSLMEQLVECVATMDKYQ